MSKKIKITIITVVYNGLDSLQKTIDSVTKIKAEEVYDISFFIIDGGSKDGTLGLIRANEDNINYWVSEPDKGIYDAMNKGWKECDSDSYILYLGSGDKVIQLPKDLSKYQDDEIIYGDVFIGEKYKFKGVLDWRIYFGNTVHHQAMLLKKTINITPPFSLDYKIYSDFDFNQRLHKKGYSFLKDENFVSYALEGGVSEVFDLKECLNIVNKNHGFLMKMLASIYYKLR